MTAVTVTKGAITAGTNDLAGRITDHLRGAVRGGIILALTAFTNVGTGLITGRITSLGGVNAPKNIGWGVGTTTAAVTQTALVTESAPTSTARIVGTESRTTGTNTNDQYTVSGTVTATSTLAITEAGLFDAATTGNMLMRSDFSPVNVQSGDSITFTFNLKFVASAA